MMVKADMDDAPSRPGSRIVAGLNLAIASTLRSRTGNHHRDHPASLEAADGDEALRVFGARAADVNLLLTDVVDPVKTRGRDATERISSMRPAVKILYMSGYTKNSIVHRGRLNDGVEFTGKPFRREQLARSGRRPRCPAPAGGSDGNVIPIGTRRT